LSLVLVLGGLGTGQAAASDLALVGGTVYVGPNEPPIVDGAVVIRGGLIEAAGKRNAVKVPNGMRVLSCAGLFVTAGFWNSHVHFIEHKWADAKNLPAKELTQQVETMVS